MRPHRRDLNTLSLSMLDVIAGTMAAFLIIMVILLPDYDNTSVDQQIQVEVFQCTVVGLDEALCSALGQAEASAAWAASA